MGKENRRSILAGGQVPISPPVLLHDDFEGALHWTKAGTGAGYQAAIVNTSSYNGSNSLAITTRVAGASAGDYCKASRAFAFRQPTELFFRFACNNAPGGSNLIGPEVFITITNDEHVWKFGYYINNSDKKIYLYDPTVNWSYFTTLANTSAPLDWCFHEFAVDLQANKYKFLRLFANEFDVSDQEFYHGTPSYATAGAEISIKATTVGASPTGLNIDDLTISEETW